MFCINCGSEIEPGRFCPICGMETDFDATADSSTDMLAPNLPEEPATAPLAPPAPPVPPSYAPVAPLNPLPAQPAFRAHELDLPQQRRSNGRNPIAVAIAAAVALVALLAAVFLIDPLGLRSQTEDAPLATSSPHHSSSSDSDGDSGDSDSGSSASGLVGISEPSSSGSSPTSPATEDPEATGEPINAAGYHVSTSGGYYITVPEGFVWSSSDPWVFTNPEYDIEMGIYIDSTSATLEEAFAWYEDRFPDAYKDIFPDNNFFVCSYAEGGTIYYVKVYIVNGTQVELSITYPEGTTAGDAVVEQVVPEFGLLD